MLVKEMDISTLEEMENNEFWRYCLGDCRDLELKNLFRSENGNYEIIYDATRTSLWDEDWIKIIVESDAESDHSSFFEQEWKQIKHIRTLGNRQLPNFDEKKEVIYHRLWVLVLIEKARSEKELTISQGKKSESTEVRETSFSPLSIRYSPPYASSSAFFKPISISSVPANYWSRQRTAIKQLSM